MTAREKKTRENNSTEDRNVGFGSTAKKQSPDDFDAQVTGLPDREPAGEHPNFGSTAKDESPDDQER